MPIDGVDFIVWEVEGLCVGGYGVAGSSSRSSAPGYIIFILSGKEEAGAEKKRFRWIQEHILFPFISKIRKEHGFDITNGIAIPEQFQFVSWCDGDNSQLFTITSKEGIAAYEKRGIIACKHGASASGTQQAADLSANFTTSKANNKKMTVVHIPSNKHDLKSALEARFKEEARLGRLVVDKPNVLVDYFAKQPKNLTHACVTEKTVRGYEANRMLDKTKHLFPVFSTLIGTCRTSAKPHKYELIQSKFQELMANCYNDGMRYIDDRYLISHGFPVSKDAYDNE